jgi:FG-GAP repeat
VKISGDGMKTSSLFLAMIFSVVTFGVLGSSAQSGSPASKPRQLKQTAYIKASNPAMGDHFGDGGTFVGHTGNALALSADGATMAVGAPHDSTGAKGVNGNTKGESVYDAGAVYVFTQRGGTWVQQAYIKAAHPGASDHFGDTVVLSADGNTMAVAAHWQSGASKGINGDETDASLPQAGAVYVFTRKGTVWSQQAFVKASNPGRAPAPGDEADFGDGDQFGYSLALSEDGNTMAVGAIAEDSMAAGINVNDFQGNDDLTSSGAAYVFVRSGSTWSQQAYVKAANSGANDLFGYSIGLSGDGNTLGVGAYDEGGSARFVNGIPDNLRNGAGAIYVFRRNGKDWRQTDYLKGSRSENGDSMGYSMAISEDGNTIVAGAADEDCMTPGVNPPDCEDDRESDTSTGAVYVFVFDGNRWSEQAFIKSSNPGEKDWFGVRTALSGDGNTLLVGAPNEDGGSKGINGNQSDKSAAESGAAYLFTRSDGKWSQQAYVKSSNSRPYDLFSSSMSVNRDGSRLAIGAPGEDSGAKGVNGNQNDTSVSESGAVYVFSNN